MIQSSNLAGTLCRVNIFKTLLLNFLSLSQSMCFCHKCVTQKIHFERLELLQREALLLIRLTKQHDGETRCCYRHKHKYYFYIAVVLHCVALFFMCLIQSAALKVFPLHEGVKPEPVQTDITVLMSFVL